VIESVAIERQAPHYSLGRSFKVGGDSTDRFHYEGIRVSFSDLSCPLPGGHQIDNAACALSMLEVASDRGIRFSEEAVRAGLRSVRWEGRLEVVDRHPLTLLDGAHNPAAAEAVATYLTRLRRTHAGSRIILILSLMRDKDRERFFQALLPVADEVILTQAAIPRAATVEELRGSVASWSGPVHIASSPGDALALARRIASDRDVVCATGSLMLIGDLKALLRGCELSTLRG
jgi:dihydrofolate synthase/folylpolyglutamate synthase